MIALFARSAQRVGGERAGSLALMSGAGVRHGGGLARLTSYVCLVLREFGIPCPRHVGGLGPHSRAEGGTVCPLVGGGVLLGVGGWLGQDVRFSNNWHDPDNTPD